jgi:hypothetical protein
MFTQAGRWEYAGVLQVSDEAIDTMSEPRWQRFLEIFTEGGTMDRAEIRAAIEALRAEGLEPTGPNVRALRWGELS